MGGITLVVLERVTAGVKPFLNKLAMPPWNSILGFIRCSRSGFNSGERLAVSSLVADLK